MFSLIVFFLILSVLIVVHEFGHFIIAKKTGVRVEQFSLGFGKVLFRKKKNGTDYTVSAIPLGGFVKMAGDNLEEYSGKPDEYFSKAPGKRFWIIFFGPLLNYALGILLFWMIFFIGYPTLTTKIGGLIDGFGAKEAGLQSGDIITAIDGQETKNWEDIQKVIYARKAAEAVDVSFLRLNKESTVNVRLKAKVLENQIGQKRKIALLGISPFDEVVTVRHGFLESLGLGLGKSWDLTLMTYAALGRLVSGHLSMRESMTGPLGIFFITSKAAQLGVIAVLHLMAVLSLSLAIFNLLPLPILDGGHIVFLALEKIRGKALSIKSEQIINKIGFSFILFLVFLVTYNDIVKNFGDKLSKLFLK
ncbi:MAG: RIP metalloprotease RseP [Candidatus Omnitrophica bacterium]|nr:RIP metalloprotease RseP [Candidatus Omnitrophota bacterium]